MYSLEEVVSPQQTYFYANVSAASSTNPALKFKLNLSKSKPSVPAVADDQAKGSTTSRLISQALAGEDIRYDKVAALQNQIGSGTYSVSASDVAEKLMEALQK